MENSDSKENEFITYWDNVIDFWLDKNEIVQKVNGERRNAKRPLGNKKESYYKDDILDVPIEAEQLWWFKEDKKNPLNKLLCPIHMPEPYWGDPENCSIVIVNYNPAGGKDMNPHTYRGEGKQYPKNTMIEYVNRKRYSSLAKDFPILKAKEILEKDERWWLRSYGGREWWRGKIAWMRHLIIDSPEKTINEEEWPAVDDKKEKYEWPTDVLRPFSIELCGWHSIGWPDNTKELLCDKLPKSIQERFVKPLLNAIENSTSQMAICIGAQFRTLEEFVESNFIDITSRLKMEKGREIKCKKDESVTYTILEKDDIKFIPKISEDTKKCIAVKVVVHKKKEQSSIRYYRVYDIINNGKHHIILNTFAPGGNPHPAKEFWEFEKQLLKAIENYKKSELIF